MIINSTKKKNSLDIKILYTLSMENSIVKRDHLQRLESLLDNLAFWVIWDMPQRLGFSLCYCPWDCDRLREENRLTLIVYKDLSSGPGPRAILCGQCEDSSPSSSLP